jgi:hypothetical protein
MSDWLEQKAREARDVAQVAYPSECLTLFIWAILIHNSLLERTTYSITIFYPRVDYLCLQH